jgi:predicted flap endonuclease-1-like 5' DNA nuclease
MLNDQNIKQGINMDLGQMFTDLISDVVGALPAIIAAIIVLILGYVIGKFVGRAVNKIVEKLGIEKSFDQTDVGKSFRKAGLDLSSFIGGVTTAFIFVISVVLAIQILNIEGTVGQFLVDIAAYLPRLLGGVVIIILGTVLVGFLANLVGTTLKPVFPAAKSEIADMLKNLLQIGLVAVILMIALDLMLLSGDLVYPLILGFVIIGAGIALTDGLIKSITDDHKEFIPVAGYAKFVLYSIFLIIGAGAIFATFTGVTTVIANISWAFAIAMGIMLVPVVYNLAKKMTREIEPNVQKVEVVQPPVRKESKTEAKAVEVPAIKTKGVGPGYAEKFNKVGLNDARKLNSIGIFTTKDLLEAGGTKVGRQEISQKTGIDEGMILEWVNRSDLMRIDGVNQEYANLLEESGVDTVVELARRNADNLCAKMMEVNETKKLVRRPPTLDSVKSWVEQAKQLPRKVEY